MSLDLMDFIYVSITKYCYVVGFLRSGLACDKLRENSGGRCALEIEQSPIEEGSWTVMIRHVTSGDTLEIEQRTH